MLMNTRISQENPFGYLVIDFKQITPKEYMLKTRMTSEETIERHFSPIFYMMRWVLFKKSMLINWIFLRISRIKLLVLQFYLNLVMMTSFSVRLKILLRIRCEKIYHWNQKKRDDSENIKNISTVYKTRNQETKQKATCCPEWWFPSYISSNTCFVFSIRYIKMSNVRKF